VTALVDALRSVPVIGIARRCPSHSAGAVAAAAARGGLRVLELTMDADDAPAAHVADLCVGAGTVRTAAAARAALAAGASFLVAPGFDPDVVRVAMDADAVMIPGVLTPTEIDTASRLLGAPAIVKLFPSGVLGPGYLAAVREPFAGVSFVCTGGIDAANARDFLDAGALAVGVGGSAFPAEAMAAGDGDRIEQAVAGVLAAVNRPRTPGS
jgi:2-dehydro-3-deoxyphosphogluconate aldolase/(4S)-4-hydroxy-2-oxoglutarate aldolase